MSDAHEPTEAVALIEVIAAAIRNELGEEIDAYPGFAAPERADPMNRAFRAVVFALLQMSTPTTETLPALVSRTLLHVAERRLAAEGIDDRHARLLLDEEPGRPDDWLCFLILSSRQQVEDALRPEEPDRA
jgi:hypothetical protein